MAAQAVAQSHDTDVWVGIMIAETENKNQVEGYCGKSTCSVSASGVNTGEIGTMTFGTFTVGEGEDEKTHTVEWLLFERNFGVMSLKVNPALSDTTNLVLEVNRTTLQFTHAAASAGRYEWAGIADADVPWSDLGKDDQADVAATIVRWGPNRDPTGVPTITGTPTVGETLTAGTSGIGDADGTDDAEYEYQWIRVDGTDETEIDAATSEEYEPTTDDIGKQIKVRASFTDDRGNDESVTSAAYPAGDTIARVRTVPELDAVTIPETGTEVHLAYDQPLGEDLPGASAFSVTSETGTTIRLGDVSLDTDDPSVVVVALDGYVIRKEERIEVGYTDPSTEDDANAIQNERHGDDAPSFSGKTVTNNSDVDGTPPGKPKELRAVRTSETTVELTWKAPDDKGGRRLTGYNVAYKPPDSGWTTLADTTGSQDTTYTHTGVPAEGRLSYRVSAINRTGTSEPSIVAIAVDGPRPFLAALEKFGTVEGAGGRLHHRIDLRLSEPTWVPYLELRNLAFEVTNGNIVKEHRVDRKRRMYDGKVRMFSDHWRLEIRPEDASASVTVALKGLGCGAAGGMCSERGGSVGNTPSIVVGADGSVPITLSIADATGSEEDEKLVFVITLSRQTPKSISLRYRSIPGGTAVEGLDYRGIDVRNLIIPKGVTTWNVGLAVIDDSIEDGGETVKVEISDAKLVNKDGRAIRDLNITRAVATGTIENSDPIPMAWTARFGRTVADHVLDAVEDRMRSRLTPGTEVRIGGRRIDLQPVTETRTWKAQPGLAERWDEAEHTVTERSLLLGSSFGTGAGSEETGYYGLWGRAAVSGFDGRDREVTLDGTVTTALLGADWSRGKVAGGLIVGHSRGKGGYRGESDGGSVEATLTGLYPWGRYALSDRLSTWGVAGYGEGTLTLTSEGQDPIRADLDLLMGAVGLRGIVLEAPRNGGVELAVKSDATGVRTTTANTTGLRATEAEVTRLRLGVEGSRAWRIKGDALLTPGIEAAIRHDGGDAETGTGVEVGARLGYGRERVSAQATVRALVAHEDEDYKEWGTSARLTIEPGASGRGFSLSIAPTWGAAAGAAERLWGAADARALAPDTDFEAGRRLDVEAGYGFGLALGRGVLTPFAGLSLADGGERVWRGGARWALGPSVNLALEGTRREAANDNPPEHHAALAFGARW